MRLYIDTDSNRFISEPIFKSSVDSVSFKRGDAATIELIFVTGQTALSATMDKDISFGIKSAGNYEGDFLVFDDAYTTSGTSYVLNPSFNTTNLNAALNHNSLSGDDIASITGMLEVTWSTDGGTLWRSTNTISAVVEHDVISGDEGTPLVMPSPEEWLLTALDPLSADIRLVGDEHRFYYVNADGELTVTAGTKSSNTNVLGNNAGAVATNASDSNFIGNSSGSAATNASKTNCLGSHSGRDATNAFNSNFMGFNAGRNASSAFNSNFMGYNAGSQSLSANNSNFFGSYAGYNASTASHSNFIGNNTGNDITGSRNTILGNGSTVSPTSLSGCLVIGSGATATQDNSIALGSTAYPFLTAGSGTSTGSFLVVRINGIDRKIPIYV